jgi:hypothetical protein
VDWLSSYSNPSTGSLLLKPLLRSETLSGIGFYLPVGAVLSRSSTSQPTVEYRTERRRSEGGYAAKGVDGRRYRYPIGLSGGLVLSPPNYRSLISGPRTWPAPSGLPMQLRPGGKFTTWP